MNFQAGDAEPVNIDCGWNRLDGSVPQDGDSDFALLDDGKPVRFHIFDNPDALNGNLNPILFAVYSFQGEQYENAPMEEGIHFEMLNGIPRRDVRALPKINNGHAPEEAEA